MMRESVSRAVNSALHEDGRRLDVVGRHSRLVVSHVGASPTAPWQRVESFRAASLVRCDNGLWQSRASRWVCGWLGGWGVVTCLSVTSAVAATAAAAAVAAVEISGPPFF